MTETSKNPIRDHLIELENTDYKIGQVSKLILDLVNTENEIDPESLSYAAWALSVHAEGLTGIYNNLCREMRGGTNDAK